MEGRKIQGSKQNNEEITHRGTLCEEKRADTPNGGVEFLSI